MSDAGVEDGLENLDEALGDVIANKTSKLKKSVSKHGSQLDRHEDLLARLQRQVEEKADQAETERALLALKAEVAEAMKLSRALSSQLALQGPALRDDLVRMLRQELESAMLAQQALSASHTAAINELQKAQGGHDGQVAAMTLQIKALESMQAERNALVDARLQASSCTSDVDELRRELMEAKAALEAARVREEERSAEMVRLAAEVEEARLAASRRDYTDLRRQRPYARYPSRGDD